MPFFSFLDKPVEKGVIKVFINLSCWPVSIVFQCPGLGLPKSRIEKRLLPGCAGEPGGDLRLPPEGGAEKRAGMQM